MRSNDDFFFNFILNVSLIRNQNKTLLFLLHRFTTENQVHDRQSVADGRLTGFPFKCVSVVNTKVVKHIEKERKGYSSQK